MSNPTPGYGPPTFESIRVERTGGELRSLAAPDAAATGEAASEPIRITLRGSGFAIRAMPLIVEIGDQATAQISFAEDGRSVSCELPRLPEEGAVIRVGYPPDDFTELPERFSLAMIDRAEPEPGGGA